MDKKKIKKTLLSEMPFEAHEYDSTVSCRITLYMQRMIQSIITAGEKVKIMMSAHSDRVSLFSVDYFSFVRSVWLSSVYR